MSFVGNSFDFTPHISFFSKQKKMMMNISGSVLTVLWKARKKATHKSVWLVSLDMTPTKTIQLPPE